MQLACEVLEDRTVPAQIEWVGLSSVGYFHDVNNWVIQGTQINQLPGLNDDVNINVDGVVATIYYDAALLPVQNRSFQSITSNEKLVIDGYFALIGSEAQGHVSNFNEALDIGADGWVQVGDNNSDTVLNLGVGGLHMGVIDIDLQSIVNLAGGVFTVADAAAAEGPGRLNVEGGSVLMLLDDFSIEQLALQPNGVISGTGNLFVLDEFDWVGGTVEAQANVTIEGNLVIREQNLKTVKSTVLVVDTYASWHAGDIQLLVSAIIVTNPGSEFHVFGDNQLARDPADNSGRFENNGNFKSGPET